MPVVVPYRTESYQPTVRRTRDCESRHKTGNPVRVTLLLRSRWKSRGPLAQLAEQLTLNQWVEGSSPSRLTQQFTQSRAIDRLKGGGVRTCTPPPFGTSRAQRRYGVAVFSLAGLASSRRTAPRRMPGKVCEQTSRVSPVVTCPSRSETIFGWTSARNNNAACVA